MIKKIKENFYTFFYLILLILYVWSFFDKNMFIHFKGLLFFTLWLNVVFALLGFLAIKDYLKKIVYGLLDKEKKIEYEKKIILILKSKSNKKLSSICYYTIVNIIQGFVIILMLIDKKYGFIIPFFIYYVITVYIQIYIFEFKRKYKYYKMEAK